MMTLESGYQTILKHTSNIDGQSRIQRVEIKSGPNKQTSRFSLHMAHNLGCIASPITTQSSLAGTDEHMYKTQRNSITTLKTIRAVKQSSHLKCSLFSTFIVINQLNSWKNFASPLLSNKSLAVWHLGHCTSVFMYTRTGQRLCSFSSSSRTS